MKKLLKIGGIAILALFLLGAGLVVLRMTNRPVTAETPVATTVVERGHIEETVTATGNVAADRQVSLAFASSAEIVEVLVQEGQQVEAGEVLARLDTTSLEWQVARAQASLDTAQARLEQAQKPATAQDLASAQAALDSAQANYAKVEAGPSAEEVASARASLDSARANYKKVQAGPTKEDLAAAEAQLESARASLKQAQAAYDRIKDQPDVVMRQESLNLQNATISLEQAQANYDALANHPTSSELASASAQVAQAEASLAALLERPTDSELASAASQVTQAKASLAQLQSRPDEADMAVYQAQVAEAVVALDQARSQLGDALIEAPFAGTIISVQIQAGEWASPGAPAIVLAVTQPLILALDVDEADVAQLAQGQAAYLSFDALKTTDQDRLLGTVTQIDPASTNVGGAVAYGLEISFDPGPLPIRLGMTANVDIVVASADDALLVPNRAIDADREAGRYYVTRQRSGGTTERIEVRIGLRNETNTQIVEGLEEGDLVVLPQVPTQGQSQQFGGPPGGGFMGGMRNGGGQ